MRRCSLYSGGLFLLLVTSACTSAVGPHALRGGSEEYPRLRYDDGQVSRNDACAIKLSNRLSPRVRPLYVNGAPVGFC